MAKTNNHLERNWISFRGWGLRDWHEYLVNHKSFGSSCICVKFEMPSFLVSIQSFKQKYKLPFTLLSDEGNKVRKDWGVPSDLFGALPGRQTYVLDRNGVVRLVYNNQFQPEKHIDETLKFLQSLWAIFVYTTANSVHPSLLLLVRSMSITRTMHVLDLSFHRLWFTPVLWSNSIQSYAIEFEIIEFVRYTQYFVFISYAHKLIKLEVWRTPVSESVTVCSWLKVDGQGLVWVQEETSSPLNVTIIFDGCSAIDWLTLLILWLDK